MGRFDDEKIRAWATEQSIAVKESI